MVHLISSLVYRILSETRKYLAGPPQNIVSPIHYEMFAWWLWWWFHISKRPSHNHTLPHVKAPFIYKHMSVTIASMASENTDCRNPLRVRASGAAAGCCAGGGRHIKLSYIKTHVGIDDGVVVSWDCDGRKVCHTRTQRTLDTTHSPLSAAKGVNWYREKDISGQQGAPTRSNRGTICAVCAVQCGRSMRMR